MTSAIREHDQNRISFPFSCPCKRDMPADLQTFLHIYEPAISNLLKDFNAAPSRIKRVVSCLQKEIISPEIEEVREKYSKELIDVLVHMLHKIIYPFPYSVNSSQIAIPVTLEDFFNDYPLEICELLKKIPSSSSPRINELVERLQKQGKSPLEKEEISKEYSQELIDVLVQLLHKVIQPPYSCMIQNTPKSSFYYSNEGYRTIQPFTFHDIYKLHPRDLLEDYSITSFGFSKAVQFWKGRMFSFLEQELVRQKYGNELDEVLLYMRLKVAREYPPTKIERNVISKILNSFSGKTAIAATSILVVSATAFFFRRWPLSL